MTIASTISRVQYQPNGSTQIFAFPYYFLDNTHLVVTLTSADGVDTLQVLNTDYTVTGALNPSGGSITMLTAPVADTVLTIQRVVPLTQLVDYIANDDFPAETHEAALDKLTMICQQLSEQSDAILARTLRFPDTEPSSTSGILPNAADRAETVVYFDENGQLSNVTLASLISAITPATGAITTSSPTGTATEKSVTVSIDGTGINFLVDVWIVDGGHASPTLEETENPPDSSNIKRWQVLTDTNGDATVTLKHEGSSTTWRLCFAITGSTVISLPITIGV